MLQVLSTKHPTTEAAAHEIYEQGPLGRLKLGLVSGFKLARDPRDTNQVFFLARSLGLGNLDGVLERLRQTAAGRALLARRPAIDRISTDFDALRRLPADTLGGAYARMLDDNGLSPDVFQRPPALPEDLAWTAQRIRQTHDLWHVLTGLRTDVPGEVALQAFAYAQLKLRLSHVLMTVGLILFGPISPRMFALTRRWYLQGLRAPFLLEVAWEDRWSQPLAEVRREFGITPE